MSLGRARHHFPPPPPPGGANSPAGPSRRRPGKLRKPYGCNRPGLPPAPPPAPHLPSPPAGSSGAYWARPALSSAPKTRLGPALTSLIRCRWEHVRQLAREPGFPRVGAQLCATNPQGWGKFGRWLGEMSTEGRRGRPGNEGEVR